MLFEADRFGSASVSELELELDSESKLELVTIRNSRAICTSLHSAT